ncbi:MAG: hypothetical protein ACPHLK_07400 [Gammaproteobacteria bacterium]|jgi:hypothetical protein
MDMIKKIKQMPILLAVLTLAGIVAPLLAVFSVLTVSFDPEATKLKYGAAANLYELLLVFLLSIPASVASFMVFQKKGAAIYFFIVGWILICLSPLCLSGIKADMDSNLIELIYYGVLGIVIGGYLLKSKDVKNYFSTVVS